MKACIFVALGGAVGSVLRYLAGLVHLGGSSVFPYKTVIINIAGSFLIGLIAAFAGKRADISPDLVLFLKVGLCGGFTTFSTFAYESGELLKSGHTAAAVVYMTVSTVLSVIAAVGAQLIVCRN